MPFSIVERPDMDRPLKSTSYAEKVEDRSSAPEWLYLFFNMRTGLFK